MGLAYSKTDLMIILMMMISDDFGVTFYYLFIFRFLSLEWYSP